MIVFHFLNKLLGYCSVNLDKIELPSNRKFGLFFTFVFALCACYFFYNNALIFAYALIGTSKTFFLVSMLKSDILLPLNKLWMRFGKLFRKIVNFEFIYLIILLLKDTLYYSQHSTLLPKI